MAYVQAAQSCGMGRYRFRRGLGDESRMVLCPGGPGCPDNPTPGETVDVFTSGPARYYDSSGEEIYPESIAPRSSSQSFTSFVNQNAGKLAIGGAVLLFFAMAVKR